MGTSIARPDEVSSIVSTPIKQGGGGGGGLLKASKSVCIDIY